MTGLPPATCALDVKSKDWLKGSTVQAKRRFEISREEGLDSRFWVLVGSADHLLGFSVKSSFQD